MKVARDMKKLIILIPLVIAIIVGIHYLGKQVDNQTKYQHPITKPGAHW